MPASCTCAFFLNAHELLSVFTTRRGARYYLPGVSCGTPTFFGLKEAEYLSGKEGRMLACLPAYSALKKSGWSSQNSHALDFPQRHPKILSECESRYSLHKLHAPLLSHPQKNEQLLIRPRVSRSSNLRLEQVRFTLSSQIQIYNFQLWGNTCIIPHQNVFSGYHRTIGQKLWTEDEETWVLLLAWPLFKVILIFSALYMRFKVDIVVIWYTYTLWTDLASSGLSFLVYKREDWIRRSPEVIQMPRS